MGCNVVSEVVSAALKRGVFNRSVFDKHGVLTSEDIQDRYAEIVKRRQSSEIDWRYALGKHIKNAEKVDSNEVNVNNNYQNDSRNSQSKENESKINESIFLPLQQQNCACADKEIPTVHQVAMYMVGKKVDIGLSLHESSKFIAYNANRHWDCLPDWKLAADL